MIEDMTLRKFSPKTQTAYIRAVANFTRFLGRSPDTAEAEDLRRYQLHLVEQGGSSTSLNATITGLKFFFEVTLDRPEAMKKMRHVYEPRKLPEILSLDEVTRLLQAAGSLKYQAALGVAYGAGACQRGRAPQGHRHRQRTDDPPGRAGQRPTGSPSHALTGTADDLACLVAGGAGDSARCSPVVGCSRGRTR